MLAQTGAGVAIAQTLIAATAGMLGVAVGGLISARSQRREHRNDRIRQQLEEFYSPLIGMQKVIRAKSEIRSKLHAAGNKAWAKLFDGVHDPVSKQALEASNWPRFAKLIDYSDEQLREDLVPAYRQMLDKFTRNMWLAEPATLQQYPALVEFVEMWNRMLSGALPSELLEFIEHKEASLLPLYEDLQQQFDHLSSELKQ